MAKKAIVVAAEWEAVVAAFGAYQLTQRRLARLTVQMDSDGIRACLAWRASRGSGSLRELTPDELVELVVAGSPRGRSAHDSAPTWAPFGASSATCSPPG